MVSGWNTMADGTGGGVRSRTCSTGPALCVLEKLAHIEETGLLPDDTMLVRYHVPDQFCIGESPLEDLPEGWLEDEGLT